MNSRKLLNLSLQTFLFRGFLRFLFLFIISYILGIKKHTLFNKFLSQKGSQYDWKKRSSYEGGKGTVFCMLYSGHKLFIE